MEADVVVAGSGGAGLTAAILAHDNGANVVVIERSDKVGGTTAVSGGGLWIPMNDHMSEVGASDSREEALTYCMTLTDGQAPDELVEAFVDTGAVMVRYLEEHTPLKFSATEMPDYRSEEQGAKMGGRTLDPELLLKSELGEWEDKLRPSPLMFVPLKIEESLKGMSQPKSIPVDIVVNRMKTGIVASGNALVGRLLKGCIDRGITILIETRARELVRQDGAVVGIKTERDSQPYSISAKGGVVLACGGFEWNEKLREEHLPIDISGNCSPAHNDGDGLSMALDAGADVGNMDQAWIYPGSTVPSEEHEGLPVSRWIMAERTLPHVILVNKAGNRFANEAQNYHDFGKSFLDAANLPCWAIFDNQYRSKYPVLTSLAGDPDPDWLAKADSLSDLADALGIDNGGLRTTVERWNELVDEGKDTDFGRGDGGYERWLGDQEAQHPNLGTIAEPPFYALPVYAHSAGTKGGPKTNAKGEVIDPEQQAIPGLYAAGNVMANVAGPSYYGGGGTIGLAMTWGYICGINAAKAAQA
jgi:succinate dehydrogenase/fumarate reductase flavoprotein subunit